MKRATSTLVTSGVFFLSSLLGVSPVWSVAQEAKQGEVKAEKTTVVGDEIVKRGAAIGDSPAVALKDVTKAPQDYLEKKVIFEATVAEVCQKKGCWMEVVAGEAGTRVTFENYGFFVPMDSQGMWVRAEGFFVVKVWSKEDADHLEGEGAHLVRNEDGSASELSFVASGVELRPGPPAPSDSPTKDAKEKDNS